MKNAIEEADLPVSPIQVLLIDDDPNSPLTMGALLENIVDSLVHAPSGEDGLKLLLGQDFSAILLDIRLPGMDGFETAELIRSREHSQHTPLIFLTGVAFDQDQIKRGYSLGAVDYLLKPVAPEILRSKVAVFVDLFKMREEIKRTAILQVQEARQTTERLRALSSADSPASITPIRQRDPKSFAEIERVYRGIIDDYLEHLRLKKDKPRAQMNHVISRLGDLAAGPRDLIDVHMAAVEALTHPLPQGSAIAMAVEARLMALEMMGCLVEHYRVGTRQPTRQGDTPA